MKKISGKESFSDIHGSIFEREAMFIFDIDSLKIMDANQPALEKYGYSKSELQKMKISDLGERVEHQHQLSNQTGEEKIVPKEIWRHRNKNGAEWLVQLTTQKFRYRGRPVRIAIAHEIDSLVEDGIPDLQRLPRIDLIRNQMPFGLIEWSSTFEIRDFSEKAEFIFETEYSNVIEYTAKELPFISEEFLEHFREKIKQAAKGENTYFLLESTFINSRGKQIICLWHNSVMLDSDQNILSIYSLVEDITKQTNAILDLKKSEIKFRVMSEQSFVGIYILKDRSFTYVNPRLTEITGYTLQEFMEEITVRELIHPDDFGIVNKHRKIWEENSADSFEFSMRILSKTGDVLHVKTYGSAIKKDGEKALLGVVVDQTDQVKALESYRSSLQSYQSLFDSITDSIYIQDEDGRFLEINTEAEKMYGYAKDEILGKDPSFLAAEKKVDLNDTMNRFRKALEGEPQSFRWWGKRKNGEIFPKEIKLSKGSFFGRSVVIAVAREITENVRKEEELRKNEQLFEQLFRNSPLGIAMLDKNSKILQVNKSFESMFGYRKTDITGTDLDELIVPKEDRKEARKLSESKDTFTLTKRRVTKSGELIDVFIYGVPVVVDGETIAIYGIYMDITDRIEAEERVKTSLKEKEILLSEIHHRVKNNLAVITGLLELQYHNLSSEEAKSALRESQMRIRSMALIHEKLYQNESLSEIDFGVYIEDLVNVIVKIHSSEESSVQVSLESVPVELPIKKAIPCGLIINEIVTNSLKYAFPGDYNDPLIDIKLDKKNERALIQISDNGVGLPAPFEEIGEGSLGTLLINTLIGQLEADLTVDGENGTTYKFSFDLQQR